MADSKLTSKDQFSVGCSDNQESTSDDSDGYKSCFRNIKCKEHTMKGCSFYCIECEEFICGLCITKAHRGHNAVWEEDKKLSKLSLSKVSPITSGSAEVRDKTEQQQKPEIKVIRQFDTDSIPIYGLTTCSGDFMFMMLKDYSYGNLNYMYQAGGYTPHMQIKSCKCFKVFDIAVDSTNNILLSVEGESVLRVFNVTTKQISNYNYNVAPLITKGIHVTRERKVIIGAVTTGTLFMDTGRQMVIVINEEGTRVKQYELDNKKKPLFTFPYRITSTSNGNICVVDVLDESYRGRVVVLAEAGNVVQIYNSHPDVNSLKKMFRPSGIVTTPGNNIVVADCDNHTLHILSCDGAIFTYIRTDDVGIRFPYSLALSGQGHLYIGCASTDSDKAKLYQVQFSGF